MLTGLEGDSCNRTSGCWRYGTGLRAGNSCETTGGVCSTCRIERRVGEDSPGAFRLPFSAAMLEAVMTTRTFFFFFCQSGRCGKNES